jgi:hypothetical protein
LDMTHTHTHVGMTYIHTAVANSGGDVHTCNTHVGIYDLQVIEKSGGNVHT